MVQLSTLIKEKVMIFDAVSSSNKNFCQCYKDVYKYNL